MGAEWRPDLLAWQVEQHQKEHVKHEDCASVHDDLHCCQEFRTHEQEYACDMEEQSENPEHAVNRISTRDGEDRARDTGSREVVEGDLSREDWHVTLDAAPTSGLQSSWVASASRAPQVIKWCRVSGSLAWVLAADIVLELMNG